MWSWLAGSVPGTPTAQPVSADASPSSDGGGGAGGGGVFSLGGRILAFVYGVCEEERRVEEGALRVLAAHTIRCATLATLPAACSPRYAHRLCHVASWSCEHCVTGGWEAWDRPEDTQAA